MAALDLRTRRPEAFEGAYEPIDAGERAIAYVRGNDVLVAAEIFPGGADAIIDAPSGRWRSTVNGRETDLPARIRLADLLDDRGTALLERY